MRSESGSPIRRLRGPWRDKPSLVIAPEPVAEPVFLCEKCRREFPITDRSRVALGRCRACA
jgi:hypothetical protein